MIKPILSCLMAVMLLTACSTTRNQPSGSRELDALQQLMAGTFTSAQQAAADSSYFDITLHMYPIWADKGHWLYVEQAVSAMPEKPYRQRVYKLEQTAPSTFKSFVYTLPSPEDFIGAWQDPSRFEALQPEQLQIREGCEVVLQRQKDGSYQGSTEGKGCESQLRGASYATSEVSLREGLIISWDRGFDTEGKQVWGAEQKGYEFRKQ